MKLTKSTISHLIIAGYLCIGCTSTDDFNPIDEPTKYISFANPDVRMFGVQTRSSLVKTDDLDEFTVCGFCVPQNVNNINNLDYSQASADWKSKSKFCRPNVFTDAQGNPAPVVVKKNGSGWEYDNVKQWISPFDEENKHYAETAKFTFIAWANGKFTLDSFTPSDAPKLRFSMPFSGGTSNNPQDCDHMMVTDALIAARYDHEQVEGKVPMHFEHILTALRFRIANHSNETLTIKSMTFRGNFFGAATFTYENSVLDKDVDRVNNRYWGRFTLVNSNNPVSVPGNTLGRIIGVSDDNPDGLTILLLPDPDVDPTDPNDIRKALGDDKYIDIAYSLEGAEFTTSIPIDLSYVPEQSTRHTATFNFLGKNQFYVIFKPETEVWENGSDATITIN